MRVLKIILVSVVLIASFGPRAMAVDGGSGVGSGGSAGGTITAGVQFGVPPSAQGKTDSSGCIWISAGEAQTFDSLTVTEKVVNGIRYLLFYKSCPTSGQAVWIPELRPPSLGRNAADAVKQRLVSPTIGSAPSVDKGIVKVGMWLWTDPNQYRPVSITAWVPTLTGIAWATTTARPVRLVFLSGEPGSSPMSCQGPGRQWQPEFGDDLVSACMYTYQHSSGITATNVFAAKFSIVWSIRWRSNVAAGGSLGEFATSTDQAITVNEIQAVVSN